MPRYTPPSHYDERLASGTLTFYKSDTNSLLTIYADSTQLTEIDNPVDLGVSGDEPNIFYSGSARVVGHNSAGDQVFDRDPVGGTSTLGNFSDYDEVVIYNLNDLIVSADNKFYKSLQNGNVGNDPSLLAGSNTYWLDVRFVGIWNSSVTYAANVVVESALGHLWYSVISTNINNAPDTDDGTKWLPAVNGAKLPEIITLKTDTTTVIPHTGGGALTALRVNELHDAGAYTLPLANSVSANQTIIITLPDKYKSFEPTVTRAGSDTISYSVGNDTSITFGADSSIALTLISDGSTDWRL